MSAHTPGPWCHAGISVDQASTGSPIAITDDYAKSYAERQANARLIAAAPDLLEAAQTLVRLMDSVSIDPMLGDDTDRVFTRGEFFALACAIAKAEGKS